ncbi:MAG: serine/threonine-protein kinase [Planctomycetota bacterium]|nr:serine/threonine-protein kinase [Planctomycetota bacterium]MDA1214730.1 serine/threonine-protein kinase [Planctomycetota bacterium]
MKFTYAPESRPLDGFTIKRAVHRGHFGEVYFAVSDAGKEVALKLLRQDVDVELRGVTQCLNLKHPHLVTIFDIRQDDDGDHWIVMEYVSGQRLDQMIAEYPRGMPMEKVLAWLNGLTEGLTYMHRSGVVHRDLKPANLFWDHGHVKIGDVGLSKIISPSKKSAQTQSVGTVYYMAPEVAHGKYGRTVDVYSLGVMLVEMLTGELPFEGETVAEILFKHLTGEPDLSRCPTPVRSVLARALEKDPDKRIASVDELRSAFERAVKTGTSEPYVASTSAQAPPENSFEKGFQNVAGRSRSHDKSTGLDAGPSEFAYVFKALRDGFLAIVIGLFGAILFLVGLRSSLSFMPLWLATPFIVGGLYLVWRQIRPHYFYAPPKRHGHRSPTPLPPKTNFQVDELEVVEEASQRTAAPRAKSIPPIVVSRPLSYQVQRMAWEMIISVICTVLLTGGLTVVSSQFGVEVPFHGTIHTAHGELVGLSREWDFGMVGFFGAVTILSVWGLLLPIRLGEWRDWDGGTCRLISGIIGIAVGTVAYLLDLWLLIPLNLPEEGHFGMVGIFDHLGRQPLLGVVREPTWFGYALFFFMLFALVRWWKQGTAFRLKRFRTWAVFTTVFASFIITVFWAFPMNWALTWAAVISSVVQLSSLSYGQPPPGTGKKKK